jgi:hypothetical protein
MLNTTGYYNTATGSQALTANATGYANTAVGDLALASNTMGHDNVALGGALGQNTIGANNTAAGTEALGSNSTGSGNNAIGFRALFANSSGNGNTAVGDDAVPASNGNNNTVIGSTSMTSSIGSNCTSVGAQALSNLSVGDGNIAIGYQAGKSLTGGANNIYIGADAASASETNFTRIGNITGVAVSGVNVLVSSSGQLGVASSSRSYKEKIHDMGSESDVLMSLRPVSFKYKKVYDARQSQQYGLVAEEVAQVAKDLVEYSAGGRPDTVRYHLVNAMLLNEVQKQHKRIAEQAARIEALERRLESQKRCDR